MRSYSRKPHKTQSPDRSIDQEVNAAKQLKARRELELRKAKGTLNHLKKESIEYWWQEDEVSLAEVRLFIAHMWLDYWEKKTP